MNPGEHGVPLDGARNSTVTGSNNVTGDNNIFVQIHQQISTSPEKPRLPFELETVLIPAGLFWMGSDPGEGIPDYETPRHEVDLPEYWISKFPITNAQFQAFLRAMDRIAPPELGWDGQFPSLELRNHPVLGVTWNEAVVYCRWLSAQTDRHYRLPNEAEWEKAARSYDLIGNGREWTCSLWGERLSAPEPRFKYPWRNDERNDEQATVAVRRIWRGGYTDPLGMLHCAARGQDLPDSRGAPNRRFGFRVVKVSK